MRLDPSIRDGCSERSVVAFVLVGVRLAEVRYSVVKLGRVAKVCRDRDSIAGSGVRAGQRPAAEPGVNIHAPRAHLLDHGGQFPVPELAQVIVLVLAASRVCAKPAEKDVTRGLQEVLTSDHALSLVGVLRLARVISQGRRLGLFRLQD
jgi:hypothetical protein